MLSFDNIATSSKERGNPIPLSHSVIFKMALCNKTTIVIGLVMTEKRHIQIKKRAIKDLLTILVYH